MRLIQFLDLDGTRHVGISGDGVALRLVRGATHVLHLALEAARTGQPLAALVEARAESCAESVPALEASGRLLPPVDHPDPQHCLITGTGLSHLGSAAARDAMHVKLQQGDADLTDSMKMFKWGIGGGKPAAGTIGAPPEWFFKGDGRWVVPPGQALELPAYAKDGGEEVEIVGLYVIADDGVPCRIGFALGNEYSDHVIERENYLYLAHSKLRQSSFGPELLLGDLPRDVHGHARLRRGDEVVWEGEWLSGEDNMCHSIANLEHHHFRYPEFRRAGDVHVHFFGAATGSFTQGVVARPGDTFEIAATGFGHPLHNTLAAATGPDRLVTVRPL